MTIVTFSVPHPKPTSPIDHLRSVGFRVQLAARVPGLYDIETEAGIVFQPYYTDMTQNQVMGIARQHGWLG